MDCYICPCNLTCYVFAFHLLTALLLPHVLQYLLSTMDTDRESFEISAVAPAMYKPVAFIPDVRSAQIPLLFLSQVLFSQSLVSFRN